MLKSMRASTMALLAILVVVVLIGAGFFIYFKSTGKLSSSADTIPAYGNLIGRAYIQVSDVDQIPVTNTKVTITPGTGLSNPKSTTITCAGPAVCAGQKIGIV